jgi:hypothetical protein
MMRKSSGWCRCTVKSPGARIETHIKRHAWRFAHEGQKSTHVP